MTPRERFIAALNRQPLTGRVPHFELVFFLTMEAFGKVHPSHRHYDQCVKKAEINIFSCCTATPLTEFPVDTIWKLFHIA